METAFEYKYQMTMETAEQNTSKQVSAKEIALQNVYKYSRKINFFFYLIGVISKKTELREWNDGVRVVMVPV